MKLIARRIFTKSCKNIKIEGDQVTLPKTGLSPVGTSGPLGFKELVDLTQ
jgi:hypothetical protein